MEEKIIKRNYEKNFQKYSWNQHDNLNDRLTKNLEVYQKFYHQLTTFITPKKSIIKI